MNQIFIWIDHHVDLPTDNEIDRARKRIMILTQAIGIGAALIYGVVFLLLFYTLTGTVFLAYAGLSVINVYIFFKSRQYAMYGNAGIVLVTGMGFLGQISLGGFTASGAISLYALIGPMVALLGFGRKAGIVSFAAFLLLLFGCAVAEPQIRALRPIMPPTLSMILLVANVAGIAFFVFINSIMVVSELEDARARADELLLNILPRSIADQLKRHVDTIAEGYSEVTVLFADIADFTPLSASVNPRDVVSTLNAIFSDFDDLVKKRGVEKIKTGGDSYMVAGGVPIPREDHAEAIVTLALEMLEVIDHYKAWNGQPFRLRIGINTGPVVAGVIGKHKFVYDVWGDAVNTASRMESHGLGNTIQVTESTYQRLKDHYDFEPRGVVNVKGKGEMNTYLLRGRKAEAVA